jgi:site-specific DNA-methyltransferase (adenine-specific)
MLYFSKPGGALLHGDCLEEMKRLPDNSIDMILCDLPYGTTRNKWDTIIPFEPLWAEYKRVIKPKSAIVLTAANPFTSALVMSNPAMFKYTMVWSKNRPSGVAQAKNKPMTSHEDIAVFSRGVVIHEGQSDRRMDYFPQDLQRIDKVCKNHKHNHIKAAGIGQRPSHKDEYVQEFTNYPRTVLNFDCEVGLQPTQKPVALFEYLIKTYTNEGALVLDNCAGSGTTAVACENLNRRWCCIEKEQKYCDVIVSRVRKDFQSVVGGSL